MNIFNKLSDGANLKRVLGNLWLFFEFSAEGRESGCDGLVSVFSWGLRDKSRVKVSRCA